MTNDTISRPVVHPMGKLQRQLQSLVDSGKLQSSDALWKVAFLVRDNWPHWKSELLEFEFSMQDPIQAFLDVEAWDED
ncbi:MAG: DUF4327 family protein [Thermosynechococcaceae cyanobacterium]